MWRTLAGVVRLARPPAGWLAASVLLGALAVAFGIGLMTSAGYLIARAAERPAILSLTTVIVAVRFFGLARPVARYLERVVSHDLAFRVLARLRLRFYERIEPLAPAGLEAYRRGDLVSRMVGDVDTLQNLYLRGLGPPLVAILAALPRVGVAAAILPAAAIVLAAGLLVAASPLWSSPPFSAAPQGPGRWLRGGCPPSSSSSFVARPSSSCTGVRRRRCAASARETTLWPGLPTATRSPRAPPTHSAIVVTGLTTVAVLAVAVSAHASGELDRTLVAALALLSLASFEAVALLPPAARELSAVLGSGRRVLELTDREPAVQDPRDPLPTPPGTPAIALEGVSARYSDAEPPALEHVDLTLEPGRKLALVGPSGVGKTTVVRLLLRFLDPYEGRVTLAGQDVRRLRQEDVRRAIAVAGQDAYLFSTSIRENVRLGRPQASDAEVDAALRRAKVGDWVSSLPDGAETLVGEEGTQLSGGQRQRVALARALLSEAPVLVLDEPTAHLDHADGRGTRTRHARGGRGAVGPAHHAQARRPRPRRRGRRDGLGSDVMSEVEVTRDGGVLTLTLNRPDVLNAFNTAMHKAFQAGLKEAGDASVRAVVITGEGRGFCVGQDLTEFQEGAGDIGDRLRAGYHKNVLAIRALEKPVIAAVNGPAAGAGLSLACACDIRIAGESASFVPAFIGIGLVPDSGGSYFIRGCSVRRARSRG